MMEKEKIFQDILDMAQKVSVEKDRIRELFVKSGIPVSEDMEVGAVAEDIIPAMNTLMSNLTEMAVVKISAKQVLRKSGISI